MRDIDPKASRAAALSSSESLVRDSPPETLGPYRVEDPVGQGGMGEVYRGHDGRLDRPVALKRVKIDIKNPAQARERFRREARALARVRHPAIVEVYDWIETDQEDWLVMELVEGEPLNERLHRSWPKPLTALRFARDLASGLSAIHAQGIVHRDLKPDNVMLVAPDDHVKILDFGLAKRIVSTDGMTLTETISDQGQIVGTVRFMSPEQASGQRVDARSDLFSLGVLLYEMLAGISPFKGSNAVETLTRICTLKEEPLRSHQPELPIIVEQLVQRLLEKQPESRPASAAEVTTALDQILAHLSASPSQSFEAEHTRSEIARSSLAIQTRFASETSLSAGEICEPSSASDVLASELTASEVSASGFPSSNLSKRQDPSVPDTSDLDTSDLPPTSRSTDAPSFKRRSLPIGAALLALTLAGLGIHQLRIPQEPPNPIYVAVPRPLVMASDPTAGMRLRAAAVHAGLIRGLLGYEGVAAVEPSPADDVSSGPVALAKALGADEVLTSELHCTLEACKVALKRLDGATGSIRWSHLFTEPEEGLLRLSLTVTDQLHSGFQELPSRPKTTDLRVRPQDYETFLNLDLEYQTRQGGVASSQILEGLQNIHQSSPRFLEAYLLEAELRRVLFLEKRQSEQLENALIALEQAQQLAPEDPRTLITSFHLNLIRGEPENAEAALEGLREQEPGDAHISLFESKLLQRSGSQVEALERMQEAVRRQPSWHMYADLAQLTYASGDTDRARRLMEIVLERAPNNFNERSRQAQFELLSGQPERAAMLYEALVERFPDPSELTNLGVAYLLLKRFDDAAQVFRRSMTLQPTPFAMLNLADAELLSGREQDALDLYQRVVTVIDEDPDQGSLLSVRAQAQAHLGKPENAVADIQEALRQAPDNPQVAYEASLVYTLIGEDTSALLQARRAQKGGFEERWFSFPWFDELRPRLEQPGG